VIRRDFLLGVCATGFAAALSPARIQKESVTGLTFRFSDVTAAAGIQFRHNSGGYGGKLLPETLGSGCAFLDYDGDGWQDILLVNGSDWPGHKRLRSTLRLYRNNRNGTFTDVTRSAGLDIEMYGMGVAVGDYNNDGFPDIFITCVGQSRLFRNTGKGTFQDLSATNSPFCGTPRVGRGLACGDVTGDGALDLLVTSIAGRARLYRNMAPKQGHWLMARAIDPALKRDAYGAEITVRVGDRRWLRRINPGYSYLCSNDPRAHFGLGKVERVDAIDVVWPDGTTAHKCWFFLRRGRNPLCLQWLRWLEGFPPPSCKLLADRDLCLHLRKTSTWERDDGGGVMNAIIPIPRIAISVREGTMADFAFIDRLQKTHSDQIGFLKKMALEGKIKDAQLVIDRNKLVEGATPSRTTQAKRQEVRGDTEKLRPLTSQVKAAALRESRAVSEYQECLRKRESHRQLWRTWNQFC
jgi:hypothetical protein